MCLAVIVILELVISSFFNAMKEMLSNTHPIVGLILLIIFLEILVVAKKELVNLNYLALKGKDSCFVGNSLSLFRNNFL